MATRAAVAFNVTAWSSWSVNRTVNLCGRPPSARERRRPPGIRTVRWGSLLLGHGETSSDNFAPKHCNRGYSV